MSLTIAQIYDQALRQVDLYGTGYLAEADGVALINRALQKTWDYLLKVFGGDWDVQKMSPAITTAADDNSYALPTNFRRLLRVGLVLNTTGDEEVALGRFDFANGVITTETESWVTTRPEYWLSLGNESLSINFNPIPDTIYTVNIYYQRTAPTATATTNTTVIDMLGYEMLVVYELVAMIERKQQESDKETMNEIAEIKRVIEDHAAEKDAGQPRFMSDARSNESLDLSQGFGFFRGGTPW
jgi:hypothetical protein